MVVIVAISALKYFSIMVSQDNASFVSDSQYGAVTIILAKTRFKNVLLHQHLDREGTPLLVDRHKSKEEIFVGVSV